MKSEVGELPAILCLADGVEKTAALAAWLQHLFPPDSAVPILVGGAAAEIYSGGSYTTGDLDFVGEVPAAVVRKLGAAGFVRQGRHWVHDEGQVFFEFPGSALDPDARVVTVESGRWTIQALSPEDVLVDRLAAWEFWQSAADGITAFHIWQSLSARLDPVHLGAAAEARGVTGSLARLRDLAGQLAGREPTEEELVRWAQRKP